MLTLLDFDSTQLTENDTLRLNETKSCYINTNELIWEIMLSNMLTVN